MRAADARIPILYLAPWVDIGGSDTATIDWFRYVDRRRFRLGLITTQPSPNRRLAEIAPYAEELWELPELVSGEEFPDFILSFIHTRRIRLLHIMNSRLGFEMLPDIASLPRPPKVVVQLHGEEPKRMGYVRYVTGRYGNLVDAVSMTTETLRDRLDTYDVPLGKRRLIPIGVDAEREFAPSHVTPIDGLDSTAFQILFASRLTAQKDPLLMVDVAAQLHARDLRFQIHVVGDGELAEAVSTSVARRGLANEVVMHGARVDVPRWYAACDLALLTSRFETSPTRVAHEAMAMETPLVAPDLPEMRELVIPGTGVLVAPDEGAHGYADAICALVADGPAREAIGHAARARVRSGFSLARMASEHETLYEELLFEESDVSAPAPQATPARTPASAALRNRRPGAKPLVSVIVTCFNQGRYLNGCLRSVARQIHRSIETIVVDDRSTDPETHAALATIEREGAATVVRLATNRGPSATRNAGLERARGRYVLPLDGDDLLVDDAIAVLVEQLGSAGEQIGFIYPNVQFFGSRNDYLQMPAYNLHGLLGANQCPVSSLIDREVFDRGFRFAEDIGLGHEDWDFVLTLAEHGIYGERARTKTLLCRKSGFGRSDLVETSLQFNQTLAARHPSLFKRRAAVKSEWNPALTLIALDPLPDTSGAAADLVAAAARQTCSDFEVIIRTRTELQSTELGRRLRRVPSELRASRAQALADGVELSRGRYALASYGSLGELLSDPALVERTLRILRSDPSVTALALADSGGGKPVWRRLAPENVGEAKLGALCWTATGPAAPPTALSLPGWRPLETLARWLGAHATVQWRFVRWRHGPSSVAPDGGVAAAIGAPRHDRTWTAGLRNHEAALPEYPAGAAIRLDSIDSWMPPQSRLLCRHRHRSGSYLYTNSIKPPKDWELDLVLGSVRDYPLVGTTALTLSSDRGGFAIGAPTDPGSPLLLGFVESKPLPLFDALVSGVDSDSGQRVLVAGPEDPLAAGLSDPVVAGYIEPYPIRPRPLTHADANYGLSGLIRTVDLNARRHRYGVGHAPPGLPAGELGALFEEPTGDCVPLSIDGNGDVICPGNAFADGRPLFASALRWTGEPLTWSDDSRSLPRLRASARRAYESARYLAVAPRGPHGNGHPPEHAAYLLRSPTVRTVGLHAAVHPVTRDLLLSTDPSEAALLGYGDPRLLGYLIARAPVTGELGPIRPGTPWAVRFGAAVHSR